MDEIPKLAKKHGLQLKGEVQWNEIGLDFRVGFGTTVDGRSWVLRIPRRPDALLKADQEARTLKFLKRHLEFAIPDWQIFNPELIAYPLLAGTPAVAPNPPHEPIWKINLAQPEHFTRSFAKILAGIHTADAIAAKKIGLHAEAPEEIRKGLLKDIALIKSELGIAAPLLKRWTSWIDDDTYWPDFSTVIHGDIHQAHLLVDGRDTITGVIDWTEAKVSDPTTDFVFHYMVFGEDGLKHLLNEYEARGGQTWERIVEHTAERAAAFGITAATYALKTNNTDLIAQMRQQLS